MNYAMLDESTPITEEEWEEIQSYLVLDDPVVGALDIVGNPDLTVEYVVRGTVKRVTTRPVSSPLSVKRVIVWVPIEARVPIGAGSPSRDAAMPLALEALRGVRLPAREDITGTITIERVDERHEFWSEGELVQYDEHGWGITVTTNWDRRLTHVIPDARRAAGQTPTWLQDVNGDVSALVEVLSFGRMREDRQPSGVDFTAIRSGHMWVGDYRPSGGE